jgi:putative aminopeptidase FrvX
VRAVLLLLSLAPLGTAAAQDAARMRETETVLETLVESYGVSGAEGPVRDAVRRLLPSWARPQVDTAGNLWVTAGRGEPTVVFVAHLDEVGFTVTGIGEDGLLEVAGQGGIFPRLWAGRPALVHGGRSPVPGVFLPLEAPTGTGDSLSSDDSITLRVDAGATTRPQAEALGIRIGSTVTNPKEFVRLAGHRITARSFDDRVGSAAQVLAVRRLDPRSLRHTVIFLWSVREEIGLEGAAAAARALGLRAARVHAIDTFVSADSPLEPGNFAVAPLGQGPVARALDNSSVTPPALVDSLVALAAARAIPLQVGTTNGGNDGSAFAEFGVPDVPIGWPLRYSHSPIEVADMRDVAHLAELVQAVAEGW